MEINLKNTIFENENNFNKCKEILKELLKEYSERDIESFYSYSQTQILKYSIMSQQKEIASSIAESVMNFISIIRFLLSEYERSIEELKVNINDVSIISKDFLLSEYKINVLKNKYATLEEDTYLTEAVFEDKEALQLIVTDKEQYKGFIERFKKHIEQLKDDKEKTKKELEEAKKAYTLGVFFDKNNEYYITDNNNLYDRLIDVYISMALVTTYKNIIDYTLKLFETKEKLKVEKKYKEVEKVYLFNMRGTLEELLEVTEKNKYDFSQNLTIIATYKGLIDFKAKNLNKKDIEKLNIFSKENIENFISKVIEEVMKEHQKDVAKHTMLKGGAYVKR